MLVGMPFDYCKTMCLELVKKHGLDYDSKEAAVADRDKMPVGVTSDSDLVRHRLADLMYDARHRDHPSPTPMPTGLPPQQPTPPPPPPHPPNRPPPTPPPPPPPPP